MPWLRRPVSVSHRGGQVSIQGQVTCWTTFVSEVTAGYTCLGVVTDSAFFFVKYPVNVTGSECNCYKLLVQLPKNFKIELTVYVRFLFLVYAVVTSITNANTPANTKCQQKS